MSDWQKVQGAKCSCRGQDEMCPCQNVDFGAVQSPALVSPADDGALVEELRFCAGLHAQTGYPMNSKLFSKAADAIEAQRELLHDCLMCTGTPGDQMSEETLADLPASIERISRIAAQAATLRSQLELAVWALQRADEFITNGIRLGVIRMFDVDISDPAHETPPAIKNALSSIQLKGGSDGVS